MSDLVDYGIFTEQSDIRAHVAVAAHRVLVFRTAVVADLVKRMQFTEKTATQPGVTGATARGFTVPVEAIPDLRELHFKSYPWETFPERTCSTSAKGAGAVYVICELLRRGRFPLWIESATEAQGKSIQIMGTDIIVYARQRIQVKCDWFAGRREWADGCTGNVFIQTAERNPLGLT